MIDGVVKNSIYPLTVILAKVLTQYFQTVTGNLNSGLSAWGTVSTWVMIFYEFIMIGSGEE